MELLLYGIAASILGEIISWVKNKLTGTPFVDNAAQLVILVLALIAATVKFFLSNQSIISVNDLLQSASTIWASAQVYYMLIGQWYAVHSK